MKLETALETIDVIYGRPLNIISDCLRAMIVAQEGHDFIAADFANIEGRVLAWLAGEDWKIQAFKDYDAGTGPDLYLVAAGGMYGRPPSEMKPHRQEGKCNELGMGFGGGARAALTMARTYNVNLNKVYTHVWPVTNDEFRAKAEGAWKTRRGDWPLSKEAYLAGDIIKQSFRRQNPKIVKFWYDLEDAAIGAVSSPGTTTRAGKIMFKQNGSFLWCRLPSGRCLCYPYPKVIEKKMPWKDYEGRDVFKPALQYHGVDAVTKVWGEQDSYGGKLAENVTQAVARDILSAALLRLEQHGYDVVMHVHDEAVCEVPEGFGSVDEMESIMEQRPEWATDLPIAAEGWRGKRYRK